MVRKAGITFLLLALLCAQRLLAIDALVSHSLFYLPDPAHGNRLQPSVETNWQVKTQSVHFTTTPEQTIIGRIRTDIYFFNEDGSVVQDHFILKTIPGNSVADLMTHSILGLRRYFVENGFVRMKLVLTDMADTAKPFVYRDSFSVNPPTSKPFYSDVQLLDTIIHTDVKSVYLKNGRQQVPANINFLDESKPVLHYYTELYNADKIQKLEHPLVQKVYISKKELESPMSEFMRSDTIAGNKFHDAAGDFDIRSLPSGNYYLNVVLENLGHIVIASNTQFFQRYNTHPLVAPIDTALRKKAANDTGMESVTVINMEKTFVAKYNTGQVKAILKMLLPVSDPLGVQSINGFLKKPDDIYTRYFIYNYFAAINKKDPAAAWKAFSDKIREVNKRFSENGTPGYETDRGYMFLRYGEPTEIISVPNEQGSLPYEVWQYNVLTTRSHRDIPDAVFLFYKPEQIVATYRLLHSSVPGEQQNLLWRSYLYQNNQGQVTTNSRAETYIGNK